MELEVLLFGKLREPAGTAKETVAMDEGADLKSLIAKLGAMHGEEFLKLVSTTKALRILVNGREYQILQGLETRLKDKDTVVILPPIAGG